VGGEGGRKASAIRGPKKKKISGVKGRGKEGTGGEKAPGGPITSGKAQNRVRSEKIGDNQGFSSGRGHEKVIRDLKGS